LVALHAFNIDWSGNITYNTATVNPGGDQTAFNMGFAYMKRCDDACKDIKEARKAEDNRTWFVMQQHLFDELSPYVKKERSEQFVELMRKGCTSQTDIRTKKPAYIYDFDSLSGAYRLLLRVMKECGLLMPGKEDPGTAILGGK
tara:strand:+ start:172 stop:603 length:432 start_codon:yes stop_codon:yes gene_type:complete